MWGLCSLKQPAGLGPLSPGPCTSLSVHRLFSWLLHLVNLKPTYVGQFDATRVPCLGRWSTRCPRLRSFRPLRRLVCALGPHYHLEDGTPTLAQHSPPNNIALQPRAVRPYVLSKDYPS